MQGLELGNGLVDVALVVFVILGPLVLLDSFHGNFLVLPNAEINLTESALANEIVLVEVIASEGQLLEGYIAEQNVRIGDRDPRVRPVSDPGEAVGGGATGSTRLDLVAGGSTKMTLTLFLILIGWMNTGVLTLASGGWQVDIDGWRGRGLGVGGNAPLADIQLLYVGFLNCTSCASCPGKGIAASSRCWILVYIDGNRIRF